MQRNNALGVINHAEICRTYWRLGRSGGGGWQSEGQMLLWALLVSTPLPGGCNKVFPIHHSSGVRIWSDDAKSNHLQHANRTRRCKGLGHIRAPAQDCNQFILLVAARSYVPRSERKDGVISFLQSHRLCAGTGDFCFHRYSARSLVVDCCGTAWYLFKWSRAATCLLFVRLSCRSRLCCRHLPTMLPKQITPPWLSTLCARTQQLLRYAKGRNHTTSFRSRGLPKGPHVHCN